MRRLKILHTVELYWPSVGGSQEVVKQISEHLARRGHSVTVATRRLEGRAATHMNGVHIEEFSVSGNAVRGLQGEVERYQKFLIDGDFDIMMNYAAQQWATDLAFPLLDRLPYSKVMAPCGFSGLSSPVYADYFRQMPGIMRLYDHLVFHSYTYRDTGFAEEHGLRNYTIIPNGASEEEFEHVDPTFRRRYGIPESVPLILTVGSHTGLKGHNIVIEAFRRARIGKSVLIIIGNTLGRKGCLPDCERRALLVNLVSLGRKRVMLLDPPRQEVIAAYQAADLFVFASNLECSPIVLFEAMASKTAFITVACGNAWEIVKWTEGGIVLPGERVKEGLVKATPASVVRAIEDLIDSPEERTRLAAAGYSAWKERFTWEKIALKYERLYQELVQGRTAKNLS